MFEFFSRGPKQEAGDKPRESWAHFTRVKDFLSGLKGSQNKEIQIIVAKIFL